MQNLLLSSVRERDFSAQEVCHLLLQLPLYKASRDFVVLRLDGSRVLRNNLQVNQQATKPSTVDFYMAKPATHFESTTLHKFVHQYSMPKDLTTSPSLKSKSVVVYCLPDLAGPKYNQYCLQKLMLSQTVPTDPATDGRIRELDNSILRLPVFWQRTSTQNWKKQQHSSPVTGNNC